MKNPWGAWVPEPVVPKRDPWDWEVLLTHTAMTFLLAHITMMLRTTMQTITLMLWPIRRYMSWGVVTTFLMTLSIKYRSSKRGPTSYHYVEWFFCYDLQVEDSGTLTPFSSLHYSLQRFSSPSTQPQYFPASSSSCMCSGESTYRSILALTSFVIATNWGPALGILGFFMCLVPI